MLSIKLNNNQFMAINNILFSQSIPFRSINEYYNLYQSLQSVVINDDIYELVLSETDLEILFSLVENGSILIKEIPFAMELLRVLSSPITHDESLTTTN